MFKNFSNILNIFKENKKLFYVINIFIILVVISFLLKVDTTNNSNNSDMNVNTSDTNNKKLSNDEYVYTLEKRIEKILKEIEGMNSVDVMIYTKNTPVLEPIYDENYTNETSIEIGSDGIKRETKRDSNQKQVKTKSSGEVTEKYYQYPEISGVLVVADYTGSKNINKILLNSVKTLLNIEINNIEIVLSK